MQAIQAPVGSMQVHTAGELLVSILSGARHLGTFQGHARTAASASARAAIFRVGIMLTTLPPHDLVPAN